MKCQICLSRPSNSLAMLSLFLLIVLLIITSLSFGQQLFVENEAHCGEHCIDVGSLDRPGVQGGSDFLLHATGNPSLDDCGEHCIDVG